MIISGPTRRKGQIRLPLLISIGIHTHTRVHTQKDTYKRPSSFERRGDRGYDSSFHVETYVYSNDAVFKSQRTLTELFPADSVQATVYIQE